MKISLLLLSMTLLVGACGKETASGPAPGEAAPDAAVAPATDPGASASSANTALPAEAAPDAAPSQAARDAGDAAVNASIDNNLGDHAKYQAVIRELQAAVAASDAARVAALVQYPIGVEIEGTDATLKNEHEFIARYPEFMTANIRDAIVGTKYADLFVNYKGVMFGSGQAWINGICKDPQCKVFDVKLVTLQQVSD